ISDRSGASSMCATCSRAACSVRVPACASTPNSLRPTRACIERFDKPVSDLFDMQDQIVSRIANQLGQELARVQARRAERSAKPDSMDHYFLGLTFFNKGCTAEFLDRARSHFD